MRSFLYAGVRLHCLTQPYTPEAQTTARNKTWTTQTARRSSRKGSAIQESLLPVISSLTSLSSLLPLSPLSAHRLPCLQPPFQQHFPLLSLFTNFQPPFLPVKEAAPMGAAAAIAHNSPKECQSEVICRHQVDYYFLREWKRKRGAQA